MTTFGMRATWWAIAFLAGAATIALGIAVVPGTFAFVDGGLGVRIYF